MSKDFNLEEEYGWFLDGVLQYVEDNPSDFVSHQETAVEDFLSHYGVKGMKWGVRRLDDEIASSRKAKELTGLGPDKIVRKTASGEELTLTKDPPAAMAKLIGNMSKGYRDNYNDGAFLTVKDSRGKKVGDAQVQKKSKDELNLMWLGIDKSSRGKGYATAIMKASEEFGREAGFKKMTLEVPGNSPDARHIYEKLGFKVTGEVDGGRKDSTWGGLTEMEYTFNSVKHFESVSAFLEYYGSVKV